MDNGHYIPEELEKIFSYLSYIYVVSNIRFFYLNSVPGPSTMNSPVAVSACTATGTACLTIQPVHLLSAIDMR